MKRSLLKRHWREQSSRTSTSLRDSRNQEIGSSKICKSLPYTNFLITSVSNVRIHTSVEWRTVRQLRMTTRTSKRRNWFVVSARQWVWEAASRTAQSMVTSSLSSSASSAAHWRSGSAGVILTSVRLAIRSSAAETMFLGRPKTSCLSVREQKHARLR